MDALLGAAIVMCEDDVFSRVDDYPDVCKAVLYELLFYAIAWLREVINAFAQVTTAMLFQQKLSLRLRNVMHLEEQLERLSKQVSDRFLFAHWQYGAVCACS